VRDFGRDAVWGEGVRPLALDICSGLGGWAEGLESAGWDVIRLDIADMFKETGTPKPETWASTTPCASIAPFRGLSASA